MTVDEFAKKVLIDEVNAQFIWIYDFTKNGKVNNESKIKIEEEAAKFGYKVRWLYDDTVRTADWRFDRISIQLKDDHEIKFVSIG